MTKETKHRVSFILYAGLILGFASKSLVLNTWDLLNQRLPKYYVNASHLSGALLLYDRPMFFESRQIEIKGKNNSSISVLDYDLNDSKYESYLQRRLYRFATNELNCGGNQQAAFQMLFCQGTLEILKNKSVEEVTIRFIPNMLSGKERVFHYRCNQNE